VKIFRDVLQKLRGGRAVGDPDRTSRPLAMPAHQAELTLPIGAFSGPGLYLLPASGPPIDLTQEKVTAFAEKVWNDPGGIPPAVKDAADFQRCDICPLVGQGGICDALRPSLPFLAAVDRYKSFDKITAVYRAPDQDILYVCHTTMQRALRYVAILSLLYYCQNGRQYWPYFRGIVPLAEAKDIAIRLYLNIYWVHQAQPEAIREVIERFDREILLTTRNQVKRMSLICRNDAFLNAFVSTQSTIACLALDMPKTVSEAFQAFDRL
jgi:hypothetical protein